MYILLEIITPEKVVYSDKVSEVLVPTDNGEIGILPKHIGLFAKVVPGELTIKKGASEQTIAITGGFLDVSNDKVTILADYAVRAENIEVAKAMEAKEKAEKLMKERTSEQDNALLEGQLRRAILELKIAGKRKTRQIPGQ
ncbi:MAG: ATP synthase F1 subunit epsilon [Candidatus Levybacteria bacterium]|nr:ATP synthase F1 subunit epsilon [Candidatus Levybacteria bacterium]